MAETDCMVAVCLAPGKGLHPARRIGPEGIALTECGKGANTRYINNIAMEQDDTCDSLFVTEVFTPAGHWSSYPSHRHDEDDFPRITYLNVIAGPLRKWRFVPDPAVEWIMNRDA